MDWICRNELAFTDTVHLFNPWNDNKLVKIGRDGQEIEPLIAQSLCRLFAEDDTVDMIPILRLSKVAATTSKRRDGSRHPLARMPLAVRASLLNQEKRLKSDGLPPLPVPPPLYNSRRNHNSFPDARDFELSSAAAEIYLANYMRSMNHQMPPIPFRSSPGLFTAGFRNVLPPPLPPPPPPPLPRYYEDGVPSTSYERFVFLVFLTCVIFACISN